jgi:hypothetical protein
MSALPVDFSFTLTSEVWGAVDGLVSSFGGLNEIGGHAVWFRGRDGRASLVVDSGHTVVAVDAGRWTGVDTEVALPPRLVYAVVRCMEGDPEATVSIIDQCTTAVFERNGVQLAHDLVANAVMPRVPRGGRPAATATVNAFALNRLLDWMVVTPSGMTGALHKEHPVWVGIEGDGHMTLHLDWTTVGGGRVTYRIPAVTSVASTGSEHRALFDPWFMRLIEAVDQPRQTDVTIELPDTTTGWVTIRTPLWSAAVACRDRLGGQWLGAVIEELDAADIEHRPGGDRIIIADLGEHEVRLELLGGERGSVRLTVLLARDLEVSPMTLSEINAANAGLVGIRICIVAGRVLAGIDLPYAHLSDLSSEIERLLNQVEGLGLFLGALSDVH